MRLIKAIVLGCSLSCFLLITRVVAAQVDGNRDLVADFVWSEEFAGGSRILHSRYHQGVWSRPDTVFEDSRLNILPAVASAGSDDMMVVWSTVRARGIKLRYSRFSKQGDSGSWSQGAVLADKISVNLAPVLLAVDNGYRAFWSAHNEGDDDIFSSRLTVTGWPEPLMIHTENSTIDILPQAGFDQDRRIWVTWEAIGDEVVEQPVVILESRTSNTTGKPAVVPDLQLLRKQSENEFDLQPPTFFSSRSRASLYFHGTTSHPTRLFPGNLLP